MQNQGNLTPALRSRYQLSEAVKTIYHGNIQTEPDVLDNTKCNLLHELKIPKDSMFETLELYWWNQLCTSLPFKDPSQTRKKLVSGE